MQSIVDYVFENIISINESHFSGSNWKHSGEYDYAINVIVDLLGYDIDVEEIKKRKKIDIKTFIDADSTRLIGPQKLKLNNVSDFEYATLDMFNVQNLVNLLGRLKSETERESTFYKDFDNCINTNSESGAKLKQALGKRSLWIAISKNKYSGHVGTDSINAESLVCFLFNYNNSNKKIQELYNEWKELSGVDLDISWIKSSKRTIEILNNHTFNGKKFTSDNYYAFHIDSSNKKIGSPGRADIINTDAEYAAKLAALYQGKKAAENILGKKTDTFKNLYSTSSKDKWNPADIILVSKSVYDNKDKANDDVFIQLQQCIDGEQLNMRLIEYATKGIIVPISLKKITTNGNIYSHNNIDSEALADKVCTIDNIKVRWGQSFIKSKTSKNPEHSGNFMLIGYEDKSSKEVNAEIQIRAQSHTDNLSIEAHLASGSARAGKCIDAVKRELGIKNNDYYKNFTGLKQCLQAYREAGFMPVISDKIMMNLNRTYKDIHKRTCFKGLLGLFEVYKKAVKDGKFEKVKAPSDNNKAAWVTMFCQYLWDHCVDCASPYFIIK